MSFQSAFYTDDWSKFKHDNLLFSCKANVSSNTICCGDGEASILKLFSM